MSIKLIRVDDRLIHGQVCTTWVKFCSIERIDIIDNAVADDLIQQTILKLTAPPNVEIHIYKVDDYISIYRQGIDKRTMLIFTNPGDIYKLFNMGMDVMYINIGGMKYQAGKRQVTNSVSLGIEDIQVLREMVKTGIKIEIQMVPTDKKVDIVKYL